MCGVKMKLKISMLAALLLAVFPFTAQAQETNSYESLNVSCESGAECNDFGVNFSAEGNEVAQTRRRRTRRTRGGGLDTRYYTGGNIGLFIPFVDDNDVGFTFGGLFGYRFNKSISAELEIYDSLGGTEIDDLGYNVLGISANGVYRYHFNPNSSRSLYAFGGLGLGVGIVNATGDVADDLDIDSETGFLLQTKAGVGYPLSEQLDIFGQTRFTNVFIGDVEDFDGLSFDVGATFKF